MKKNIFYFLVLIFSTTVLGLSAKYILNTDELFINSIAEELTSNQITRISDFKSRWLWASYLIVPVISVIKISLITLSLSMGLLFFFEIQHINYNKIFEIVLKSEFVFLLVIVFKTAWFYFFKTDYNLEDLQYFYPLSALNIIGYKGLQPWFIYPFQVLNLFELAYWFILAYLLGKEIKETTEKGFVIISSSYGVGLLIWIVGVMFLTLNMS